MLRAIVFVCASLLFGGCDAGGSAREASAAPRPSAAPAPASGPVSGPGPELGEAAGEALPTADERRETEIPAYVSVVPDPSPGAQLPCPPGTSQKGDAEAIECRVAGERGVSLSKRQGPSLWFHANGKVKRAGSYEAHEWHGRWWSFDEQGRPESSENYKNGKEDGVSVTFYPNGKRRSEIAYVDGKRQGVAKIWTEDGELMGLDVYEGDARVSAKVFRFSQKEVGADELRQMQDDLQAALAEQRRAMERQAADAP